MSPSRYYTCSLNYHKILSNTSSIQVARSNSNPSKNLQPPPTNQIVTIIFHSYSLITGTAHSPAPIDTLVTSTSWKPYAFIVAGGGPLQPHQEESKSSCGKERPYYRTAVPGEARSILNKVHLLGPTLNWGAVEDDKIIVPHNQPSMCGLIELTPLHPGDTFSHHWCDQGDQWGLLEDVEHFGVQPRTKHLTITWIGYSGWTHFDQHLSIREGTVWNGTKSIECKGCLKVGGVEGSQER